jgi:hypothetical protein
MAGTDSWTDQVRNWFERTPKAQRAVKKLSEDLDVVAGKVEQATGGLMERVGPIIDPPSVLAAREQARASTATAETAVPETATATAGSTMAESTPSDPETEPVIPEAESSVPPGVKKEGEPVDPTS